METRPRSLMKFVSRFSALVVALSLGAAVLTSIKAANADDAVPVIVLTKEQAEALSARFAQMQEENEALEKALRDLKARVGICS